MVIKEKLDSLGFEWEELDEEIYYIHNFATKEELEYCYNFCVNATEEQWNARYMNTVKEEAMERYGRDDIDNLVAEGLMHINPEWKDKTIHLDGDVGPTFAKRIQSFLSDDLEATSMVGIQRHYPGSNLAEHIDAETSEHLRYAAVFYVNDDFNGGRLYFPTRGLTVEPRAGSLIIFATGKEYLHGVGTVEDGPTRYAIANFIWTVGKQDEVMSGDPGDYKPVHDKVEY